jgi:peptide/nickel transport system substrate-binding protein
MAIYLRSPQGVAANNEIGSVSRRSLLKGAIGGGLLMGSGGFLLSACDGGEEGPTKPSKGGRLTIGVSASNSPDESLEAHRFSGSAPLPRLSALYEDFRVKDYDFKPVNRLLESMEPNDDATQWTLRLREGIEFHHGKTAGADDMIFTLRRVLDPKDPKLDASLLSSIDQQGFEKLDARTIRLTLTRPNAILDDWFADGAALHLVPTDYDVAKPVGTGPMKFKSFDPGQQSVFERFDNYWGEPAHLDEFVVVNIAEENARLNALLSGQVDVIFPLSPAQIRPVTSGGMMVANSPSGRPQTFVMNMSAPPFDDVRVRQAFRLILDREAMVNSALAGHGRVGNDVFSMDDPSYDTSIAQRTQDLDQARSLLKQAGREGLTVELSNAPVEGGAVEAAQIFAEQAKSAGVDIKLRTMPVTTLWADGPGDWAFANGRFGALQYLSQSAFTQGPNPTWNDTKVNDPAFEALFNDALKEPDVAKRTDIMHEMMRRDHEQSGYIIWTFYDTAMAHNPKVGGFPKQDLSGRTLGQGRDLSRLLYLKT